MTYLPVSRGAGHVIHVSAYLKQRRPKQPVYAAADIPARPDRRQDSHCSGPRSATRPSKPAELSRNQANGLEGPQRPARRTSEGVSRS